MANIVIQQTFWPNSSPEYLIVWYLLSTPLNSISCMQCGLPDLHTCLQQESSNHSWGKVYIWSFSFLWVDTHEVYLMRFSEV